MSFHKAVANTYSTFFHSLHKLLLLLEGLLKLFFGLPITTYSSLSHLSNLPSLPPFHLPPFKYFLRDIYKYKFQLIKDVFLYHYIIEN